jgi:hypothetical protein
MPSFSYSSSSMSYSTTTTNGQTTGQAYQRTSETTPEGTTVRTTHQNLGEQPVTETQRWDASGRAIEAAGGGHGSERVRELPSSGSNEGAGQAEDKEQESEADKLYRERMEDEYAKREGGA